jgi:glutamate dehydrogenase
VENDDFNRLVLRAGLAADEIAILRAYAKYLKQIGFALSQAPDRGHAGSAPAHRAHAGHAVQAALRPRAATTSRASNAQVNAIEQALDKVSNLSEDRVLRQLLALIQATLRTNFWRTGVGHSGRPDRGARS